MDIALLILAIILCIALIASVVLQAGRSAGLGAITGGAETMFGKKKGLDEVLSRTTMILSIVLAVVVLFLGKILSTG